MLTTVACKSHLIQMTNLISLTRLAINLQMKIATVCFFFVFTLSWHPHVLGRPIPHLGGQSGDVITRNASRRERQQPHSTQLNPSTSADCAIKCLIVRSERRRAKGVTVLFFNCFCCFFLTH